MTKTWIWWSRRASLLVYSNSWLSDRPETVERIAASIAVVMP